MKTLKLSGKMRVIPLGKDGKAEEGPAVLVPDPADGPEVQQHMHTRPFINPNEIAIMLPGGRFYILGQASHLGTIALAITQQIDDAE